ncbi:MAG: hypothetical protein J7K15_10395 [Deltaproteobacteria bacterium]|nr:hypothetical protein [Deltaproteobacteria bacterium]
MVSRPKEVILTPFALRIGKDVVIILEVIPIRDVRGEERYIVVVTAKGSRPFSLVVKDMEELEMKLRAELAKVKLMEMAIDPVLLNKYLGR